INCRSLKEGSLGDELLPPSSAKPGLVMNKPALAGACVRCARPSLTLLALRNTLAFPGGPAVWAVCSGRALVESCLRRCVVISLKSVPTNQELCFRKHNVRV